MDFDRKTMRFMLEGLPQKTRSRLKKTADLIIRTKENGGKVIAVLGSGPNLHEGVTCLVAELMRKGIIDGVSTSSAVINHEMSGTLERVKRIKGSALGIGSDKLPFDGYFEVTIISDARLERLRRIINIDMPLYRKMRRTKGDELIKVAGNMAYPTGLYTERIAREILPIAKRCGVPFETMAGYGADRNTIIGSGAELNLPVIVSVPQLVGGGEVGLAIGDSIPISERSYRMAKLLDSADIIIESAIALTQEIHDGPFERYTGHGIWTDWQGGWTLSLAGKKIIRIDLDPNLDKAWMKERKSHMVSDAVHKGLPKTKIMRIPFRMEMSGFSRLPGSLPLVGDIGDIWPLLAMMISDSLKVELDFMCYKQSLPAGKKIRDWIVKNVHPVDLDKILRAEKDIIAKRFALSNGPPNA
ncbi:MAG: hypothetical protein JW882_20385 [Deltaproteobacteria bacterium]|nr:hypothetical protein [Deltaproteobacteria bacterium]